MIYESGNQRLHRFGYPTFETWSVKNMKTENNKQMPVNKWQVGTLQIAEWKNQGKDKEGKMKEYSSYSIQIRYFDDKTNEYKDTNSVSLIQLMTLRSLCDKAIADSIK